MNYQLEVILAGVRLGGPSVIPFDIVGSCSEGNTSNGDQDNEKSRRQRGIHGCHLMMMASEIRWRERERIEKNGVSFTLLSLRDRIAFGPQKNKITLLFLFSYIDGK